MTQETKPRPVSASYQFFMLVLCLYAIAALAAQSTLRLEPGTRRILDLADCVVCVMFFADFVVSLLRAPNRWRYFITWGWLDLVSSIPMIDLTRWGRAARIVRVFRVLRGLRATRLLAGLVLRRRAESAFLAVSLIALLLIVFCSIAVLHFETDPESNIKSPEDALWWAFATITTVGYGDCYPVTWEGRLIATILMCAGVGLFGTFSAFLAAWFIGSEPGKGSLQVSADLRELREEVAALRRTLEERAGNTAAHQAALRKQKELFQALPDAADQWDAYNGRFRALGNWTKNVGEPFDMVLVRGKEGEGLANLWAKHRGEHVCYADVQHPFRLQGSADLNSYKMFTEVFWRLLRTDGRLGVILPTGIYSDFGTRDLREELLQRGRIDLLYAFQNEKRIFAAADHRFKQVALLAARGGCTDSFDTRFRMGVGDSPNAHEIPDDILRRDGVAMRFTPDDVRRNSPKTLSLVDTASGARQ